MSELRGLKFVCFGSGKCVVTIGTGSTPSGTQASHHKSGIELIPRHNYAVLGACEKSEKKPESISERH